MGTPCFAPGNSLVRTLFFIPEAPFGQTKCKNEKLSKVREGWSLVVAFIYPRRLMVCRGGHRRRGGHCRDHGDRLHREGVSAEIPHRLVRTRARPVRTNCEPWWLHPPTLIPGSALFSVGGSGSSIQGSAVGEVHCCSLWQCPPWQLCNQPCPHRGLGRKIVHVDAGRRACTDRPQGGRQGRLTKRNTIVQHGFL